MTVKIVTNKPGNAPKPTPYADIKGQGKIPYAGEKSVEAPMTAPGGVARGMGAAKRGGNYRGCGSDASS